METPGECVELGHLAQSKGDEAAANAGLGRQRSDGTNRAQTALERPIFHVMPESGWMNDPNGPIQHNGVYHLFFQHNTGTKWNWGIDWSHAASRDLVHWQHLPVSLKPTDGWYDADGCFSGCCVPDENGVPTIIYTAARKRSNTSAPAPPPPAHDLGMAFIESQCTAQPLSGDDDLLKEWKKAEKPILDMAPEMGSSLAGWRDPFIFEKGGDGKDWGMLIGTGIKNKGGSVMVYTSKSLTEGWKFDRFLCQAPSTMTGKMWECPSLVKLPPHPTEKKSSHFNYLLCISPDAPTNATICFLGDYVDGNFMLETALGPFNLDLGDVLYAPNSFEDSQGRRIIWGWLQEKSPPPFLTYAGCQSVPRVMFVKNKQLFQEPTEEMNQLRSDRAWEVTNKEMKEWETLAVGSPITSHYLDMEIVVEQGSSEFFGINLGKFDDSGEEGCISFDWSTSRLTFMTVPFSKWSRERNGSHSERYCGGFINHPAGQPLRLRIFVDYSLIEIFTGNGKVLSTRCYRGTPAAGSTPKIDFEASGGDARIVRASVYEMSSIWVKDLNDVKSKEKEDVFEEVVIIPAGKEVKQESARYLSSKAANAGGCGCQSALRSLFRSMGIRKEVLILISLLWVAGMLWFFLF